jgi:uncharacterized membrane protein
MYIYLLPLITASMWGLSAVLDKMAMIEMPMYLVFLIGALLYSITAIIVFFVNYKDLCMKIHTISYKSYIYALLAAITGFTIANLIYYYSLKKIDKPHVVAALAYTAPIFAFIFGLLLLHNKFSMYSLIGVIITIIGVVIVSFNL